MELSELNLPVEKIVDFAPNLPREIIAFSHLSTFAGSDKPRKLIIYISLAQFTRNSAVP